MMDLTLKQMFPRLPEHVIENTIVRINDQFEGFEVNAEFIFEQICNFLLNTYNDDDNAGDYIQGAPTTQDRPSTSTQAMPMSVDEPLNHVQGIPTTRDGPSTSTQTAPMSVDGPSTSAQVVNNEPLTSTQTASFQDPDELFFKLVQILPHYDPSYLRTEAARLIVNNGSVSDFIDECLSRKKYPTLEEYNERIAQGNLCKEYGDNFKVDEFVEKFPDPVGFFEQPDRVEHGLSKNPSEDEIDYATTYILNHYRYTRRTLIRSYMVHYNYDIVKVHSVIEQLPKEFKNPQPLLPYKTVIKNKLLLQELAYVTNKSIILNYLERMKELQMKRIEEARAQNLLQHCNTCFDDEVVPELCCLCSSGCIFCKTCVKTGCESRIIDGHFDFPCYSDGCDGFFSMSTLKCVINPTLLYNMDRRRQIAEIRRANIDGIEQCPFCDFMTIPSPDDKTFKCEASGCGKESCRGCRHESHIPLKCSEIEFDEDVKMRTYIENKMTEALLRTCPDCGRKFLKSSGCNNMVCYCGTNLCYVCGKSPVTYSHFDKGGCPLHCDQEVLHQSNIITGANKAKRELGVDNDPSKLKFDPAKDLENK